jgi:hypothetical protein
MDDDPPEQCAKCRRRKWHREGLKVESAPVAEPVQNLDSFLDAMLEKSNPEIPVLNGVEIAKEAAKARVVVPGRKLKLDEKFFEEKQSSREGKFCRNQECGKPLVQKNGKWWCEDEFCGLYGREQKFK